MVKVLNAMQLKNGAKAEYNRMGTITRPIQFLPESEKDLSWGAQNIDWLEMEGMKQLRRNAKRLLKNYKLSNGIIDKNDYIMEEDNEMNELVNTLVKEDDSALELKFFPIIPNVINVLSGEFAKRNDKILYRAIDDTSFNELMEEKRGMIEEVLVSEAEQKMIAQMQEMGIDLESEEGQQALAPENIRSLPEIEQFFRKDYQSLVEQWAQHQHEADEERFNLRELETRGFKDMLIADREFWHFKMNEDDYEIELWNPVLTFYHKSPDVRYISQGNWVGKIDLISLSDTIDKYGWMMDQDQIESLEAIYPVKSSIYPMSGYQNDGTFYDATKSYEWNTHPPSLGMRQFTSVSERYLAAGDDVLSTLLGDSEDFLDYGRYDLIRESIIYWKSQRKLGHLTMIDPELGIPITMIVDEYFKCTQKPEYDTSVIKNKNSDNLISGQHVDWIWINETWSGIKIGPNRPTFYGNEDTSGFEPIYLNVKPLRFQFKGDYTLYGCKLPVEGAVFSDRNTRSNSLVDKLKPYQIGYNLVNNQISDILIDELGTVILLDQNAIPKHSMGEDWGANNFSKAYVAMRNFQMLPLDTTISNTENAVGFQHYQVLNLEQTNRLLSRVQLANYFKMQAFEAVGITPQRIGQQISQDMTATGIETAVNMSFSQTEMYFVQHSEHLMPRIHEMRTDLAQYYNSHKPSVRLSYLTSLDEKVNFEINGTDLLSRDLNVYITTKVNQKQIMEQIRNLAIQNNTAGASIYDLANLVKADSLGEITSVLKGIEQKTTQQQEAEREAMQQMEQARIESEQLKVDKEQLHESTENQLDRENNLRMAEIRAAGYGAAVDLNNNNQSDYIDNMRYLDERNMKQQTNDLKRESMIKDQAMKQRELDIKEKELQARVKIADKALQVAKENKNKYDVPGKKRDK